MKVSVSILKEKDNYVDAINKLNDTSADYIHIDVMDNTFTDSSSFDLTKMDDINTSKKLDIHIMSTNLDYQIENAIKLKPEYITFHYESTNKIIKYINKIKDNNIKVGLAINPETNIDEIYSYLNNIDLVLVMSVVPGKGGQEFIMSTIDKLKKLKSFKTNFVINVDGGINNSTISYVKDYVDIVTSGSYVTSSDNYELSINSLKNNIDK